MVKLPLTYEVAKRGVDADPPAGKSRITLLLETTLVNEMLGPEG